MGTHAVRGIENEPITWQVAHAALSRLARQRAAADAEEGRWLLAARRAAAHVHLGFGSFSEYAERLFGYQPRTTQEKLRVAEALEDLPALEETLSGGGISWSAVRELTRVAVRATEQQWLELARGKTLRQLEELLAGKRLGDDPSAPVNLSVQRHVLRFEVAAETLALFRDAQRELRRRSGASLDDDSVLLELARSVLGGPRDEGRASYQVVLSVCPECRNGRQHADGGLVPVGPEIVAMARCDAQHVGRVDAQQPQPANDQHPPADPPHERNTRGHARGHDDAAPHSARVGARAQQSIPPALRRAVLLRDERRCQVPGCRNTRYLDLHHLELRSEGGPNAQANLTCLCSVHHRAAHRGELVIDRSNAGTLRVRHADGSEYGLVARPQVFETHAKVFSALRQLGFREGEVRAVFRQLEKESGLREAAFDALLRAALALLPRACRVER